MSNRCTSRKQRSYGRVVRVWGYTVARALFLAPTAPLPFFSTGEQLFGELARFAEASSMLSYLHATRLLQQAITARCNRPGRHRKTHQLQLCDVKLAGNWLRSGNTGRMAGTLLAVQSRLICIYQWELTRLLSYQSVYRTGNTHHEMLFHHRMNALSRRRCIIAGNERQFILIQNLHAHQWVWIAGILQRLSE